MMSTNCYNALAPLYDELLFDADRFLSLLKTVLSVAGNKSTTISAISNLSNSYDGLQLGFKLSRK